MLTALRAVRLPNEFSKEHWFIDYRFGFVKRGMVGTIFSLVTRALHVHVRHTDQIVAWLSSIQFVIFCAVLVLIGLRIIRRSAWSTPAILTTLVFLSSPFIVMSAHLIGYFDNIIIVLAVLSIACLLMGRVWVAAALQAVAMLVHETSWLIGFPVFCLAWLLVNNKARRTHGARLPVWPLLLPIGTFLLLVNSRSLAPPDLEQSLIARLSSFPFLAAKVGDVRVPHWVTITFAESFALHRGFLLGRLLQERMIGLILPSMVALLSFIVDANRIRDLSAESLILLGICLLPQSMHLLAWDTTRIWTYSILCAFLVLWVYAETVTPRREVSQIVSLFCLAALALNIAEVTPLMDGLSEHFELGTRVLFYAPVFIAALGAILWESPEPIGERLSIQGIPLSAAADRNNRINMGVVDSRADDLGARP